MSSAPVPPAPEMIVAKATKNTARPPYVKVPSITDPKLTTIPDLDQFLQLCDGEKLVKSWRIRVRKPKLHIWWLVASVFPMLIVWSMLLWGYSSYRAKYRSYDSDYPPSGKTEIIHGYEKTNEPPPYYYDNDKSPSTPSYGPYNDGEIRAVPGPSTDPPPSLPFELPTPEPTPGLPNNFPDAKLPDDPPPLRNVRWDGGPPVVVRAVASPPLASIFDDGDVWRSPLPALIGLFFLFFPACVLLVYFLSLRGHTFLYLTNRRLVVVELEQNIFCREQTVLNYTLENISGFTLHTQRGLKKLFALILLKEKRTFYMSIVTRTLAQFALGGMNTWGSRYQPGLDAVALCAELDALVLGLKAGLPANRVT